MVARPPPQTARRGRVPNAPWPEPWKPPQWEDEDAHALQALMHYRASEAQQRRAVHFLMVSICGINDLSYRPTSDRDTAFAEGKRFVALQLLKFAQLPIARLRGKQTEQGEAPKEQPT